MKRMILSLAFAATMIAGLGGVASAGDLSGPRVSEEATIGYHELQYHVEYFDCSCGHWKCYGVYSSKCRAIPVAEALAENGYKVRIQVEQA